MLIYKLIVQFTEYAEFSLKFLLKNFLKFSNFQLNFRNFFKILSKHK